MDIKNIIPTLRYAAKTIEHKVYVFRAGLKTRAPIWRLVIHDWSKFTPAELPHYGRQFFGDRSDPEGFARAWLHHQNLNPHHWEYWIPREVHERDPGGRGPGQAMEMPEWAVREMIADWMGAGRAYEGAWPGKDWPWLFANWPRIAPRLHPETRILVRAFVEAVTGALLPVHPYDARARDDASGLRETKE
jgi:hypothetical protein